MPVEMQPPVKIRCSCQRTTLPRMLGPLGSPFFEDSVITQPCPSSISEVITETPIRPSQPIRKRNEEYWASALTQIIEGFDVMPKKTIQGENHEDSLYYRSLILIMIELPKTPMMLAKIKISQLLYDIQYEDEE